LSGREVLGKQGGGTSRKKKAFYIVKIVTFL